jgi:hypothetical protein
MIGLCTAFGVDNGTAAAVTLISRGVFYICGLGVGGACFGGLALLYGRMDEGTEEADDDGSGES